MPRSPLRQKTDRVVTPAPGEIIRLFVEKNPDSRRAAEAAGEATAALGTAAASLTAEQQREIVDHKDMLPALISAVIDRLESNSWLTVSPLPRLSSELVGEGLGDQLKMAEGRRRLHEYATVHPIEEWAGEIAGPNELAQRYGIGRSTLQDWRKAGSVIAFLSGTRKHVFPIAQFVDGRPLEGLAEIARSFTSPRTAWLWLKEPNPALAGQAPLEKLKSGETQLVLELVGRDFGRS